MKIKMALLLIIFTTLTACKEQVPPGYLGMIQDRNGFRGEILDPGYHDCWGTYTELVLIEATDKVYKEKMNVLCRDQLNFGFDIKVLAAVDKSPANRERLKEAFKNVKPSEKTGTIGGNEIISAKQLYDMYVQPTVDQESRKVIGKYETSEIVSKRRQIINELVLGVGAGLKGSLVRAKKITVNNLDFPDSITKAQEKRARQRVAIDTEKAKQEKRLIEKQNAIIIAQLDYKKELIDAATIADANKIIGSSITPGYLAWWQNKVLAQAARGPNNWGFIPYTDHTNKISGRIGTAVIDAQLRKRLDEIRSEARGMSIKKKAAPKKAPPPKKKPVPTKTPELNKLKKKVENKIEEFLKQVNG